MFERRFQKFGNYCLIALLKRRQYLRICINECSEVLNTYLGSPIKSQGHVYSIDVSPAQVTRYPISLTAFLLNFAIVGKLIKAAGLHH
jgi:hypothetical protein